MEDVPTAGLVHAGARSPAPHLEGVRSEVSLWESGVIPYEITPDLPKPERIRAAIEHIERLTPVRFRRHDGESDYLCFWRGADCRSTVGKRGGPQEVDVSSYAPAGQVVHEICHALGLWHEHARPDRDRYVRLVRKSVDPAAWREFSQKGGAVLAGKPYDYESIMHYPPGACARADGLVTIEAIPVSGAPRPVGDPRRMGQREGLSEYDVKTIRALYG